MDIGPNLKDLLETIAAGIGAVLVAIVLILAVLTDAWVARIRRKRD